MSTPFWQAIPLFRSDPAA